jgi:hypothetical protein
MGFSRFTAAELDGKGSVTVSGPMHFAEDERDETVVSDVNFVLVQGDVFVRGSGSVKGEGNWGGTADLADALEAGKPAQGYGVALLVRRPQEATPATDDAPEQPARPPVVQVLAWSETLTITQ